MYVCVCVCACVCVCGVCGVYMCGRMCVCICGHVYALCMLCGYNIVPVSKIATCIFMA